ncbi:hypothetical protein ABBQ32_006923 [Trebouxia sp. C0010 RCD-2024]
MATRLHCNWSGARSAQSIAVHHLRDARFQRIQIRNAAVRVKAPVRMTTKACATEIDVAIVGGGPGGLAAAAAITSAFDNSLNVKVFEIQKAYKPQGSVIALAVNCQYALEAIDPGMLSRFTSKGIQIHEQIHRDTTGKIVRATENLDQAIDVLEQKYKKRPVVIGWHECRQLLFEELPPETVEFDKQMTHYVQDDHGVTLHFQPAVHAKLLVGADGYFSKVRTQCLDDGPPTFSKSVHWRARVGWQEGMPKSNTAVKYTLPGMPMWSPAAESRGALVIPMGTMESTKDKGWTWILGAPIAEVRKAGVHFDPSARTAKAIQGDAESSSALENALKVFSDFPPELMGVVRQTDPATVTQHGLYMRDLSGLTVDAEDSDTQASMSDSMQPSSSDDKENNSHDALRAAPQNGTGDQSDRPTNGAGSAAAHDTPRSKGIWGQGRVTLVGDAAHATINNGQGFCLAVEDGVVLAWHLRRQGLCQQALRMYEKERLPRVRTVYQKGNSAASAQDKEEYLYKPTFKALWRKQEDQEDATSCITDFKPLEF